MGLADLYAGFQRIVTLDRRVHALEEQVQHVLSRQEAMSTALVRLDARIETVKAETLAEFYRQVATAPSPSPPSPAPPALPPGRRSRRPR